MIYLIAIILLSMGLTFAIISARINKDLYEIWLHDLESYLECKIEESDKTFLLPHIYNENHLNIKWAAYRFRELKTQQIESKCAE